MPFDLNVLVVNQINPTIFDNKQIKIENEIHDTYCGRFSEIWPFMTRMNGIWYSLVKEYKDYYSAHPIIAFNDEVENNSIPTWIKSDIIKDSLTPLIIRKEYIEEVKEIIRTLIVGSPVKTIMLLATYQCPDFQVIQGMMSLEQFEEMLEVGEVLFNTCYIVDGKGR